ncbi:MT-A70 family methyltransferase [Pararhizobium haloflavum]|uniref:MT-A70 family methyltransferase n=1 Tax=Pararhizobium haloflavum TaxID=2037914 RepID=UPI000C1A1F49|nr:MT-A70 family methyltransferase [Pararhizobium haloflavum]
MKYQLLPPLSADDRAALEASIVQHGVLVPVEYDENGEILDGHHRVEICESLGLVDWPRFVRKGLAEDEKRTLARELNVSRRHLNAEQKRALIADQLRDTPSISSRAIAAMLGAHHSTVEKVRKDLEATGEISQLDATEGLDGRERPRKAIRTAFMPEPDNARELMATVKAIRTRQREHGRKVRTDLINEIAARGEASAGTMPRAAYPILYADPPWEQEAWSDETGQDRGLMYPPMPLDAIKGLLSSPPLSGKPLAGAPYPNDRSPATRDALLFLWVTSNRLDDGIDVLRAWGFDYVTCLIWDKETIGMGRWVRDRHEILLLGKRGNFPAPLPGTQAASVHAERKGRHSAKPVHFAAMIERLYPEMRKLELFQRTESLAEDDPRRSGQWDFWGFESDSATSSSSGGVADMPAAVAPPCAAAGSDRPSGSKVKFAEQSHNERAAHG